VGCGVDRELDIPFEAFRFSAKHSNPFSFWGSGGRRFVFANGFREDPSATMPPLTAVVGCPQVRGVLAQIPRFGGPNWFEHLEAGVCHMCVPAAGFVVFVFFYLILLKIFGIERNCLIDWVIGKVCHAIIFLLGK